MNFNVITSVFIKSKFKKSNPNKNQMINFENRANSCVICHEEITALNLILCPNSHNFHYKCLDRWLDTHNNCPFYFVEFPRKYLTMRI
ncbi:MAG: RING finger protein [Candidatus Helarchaeota archaeon]